MPDLPENGKNFEQLAIAKASELYEDLKSPGSDFPLPDLRQVSKVISFRAFPESNLARLDLALEFDLGLSAQATVELISNLSDKFTNNLYLYSLLTTRIEFLLKFAEFIVNRKVSDFEDGIGGISVERLINDMVGFHKSQGMDDPSEIASMRQAAESIFNTTKLNNVEFLNHFRERAFRNKLTVPLSLYYTIADLNNEEIQKVINTSTIPEQLEMEVSGVPCMAIGKTIVMAQPSPTMSLRNKSPAELLQVITQMKYMFKGEVLNFRPTFLNELIILIVSLLEQNPSQVHGNLVANAFISEVNASRLVIGNPTSSEYKSFPQSALLGRTQITADTITAMAKDLLFLIASIEKKPTQGGLSFLLHPEAKKNAADALSWLSNYLKNFIQNNAHLQYKFKETRFDEIIQRLDNKASELSRG